MLASYDKFKMKPIKSHIHGSPSMKNIIEIRLRLRFCLLNVTPPPVWDQIPQHKLRANKTKSSKLATKMGPVTTKKYSNVETLSSKKHLDLPSSTPLPTLKGRIMSAVTSSGRKWIMMVTDYTINGTPKE